MKEAENINASMKPLGAVAAFLGLNPIRFNPKSRKYKVSKARVVYSLIFGVISTTFMVLLVEHAKISQREAHSNSISQASFWFDLYAGIFLQITGVVMSSINAQTIAKVLNEIIYVDRFIAGLGSKISSRGPAMLNRIGLVCIFIEFCITAVPDYLFFSTATQTKIFLVTSYFTIITNGVIKLQFVAFAYLIYKRFRCINRVLKQMVRVGEVNSVVCMLDVSEYLKKFKQNPEAERINIIHHVHNMLCKLCSASNWLYGFQLLSVVSCAFNITISEFYYCYTVSKTSQEPDKALDIYFSVQWGLLQQMEIFGIVWFCNAVQSEAGKTIHLTHFVQHQSDNEELTESLKLFSLHEMHKNVKFTACGLFPLDYTLLLMIYAAVTSYLVIMIQYDMAKTSIESTPAEASSSLIRTFV